MLSTDPGQSLNKEMLTLPACAPVLHVRCEVPTQRKKLFLFLGPFPKPGACSGSPDKNHPINWQLKSGAQAGCRFQTRELAEVLLPDCLAAHRPPWSGLRSRFSCWDYTPAQCWQLGHGGARTWCPDLRQATGKLLLQRYGDSQLAWINPLFSDLNFILAEISSSDENPTIISNSWFVFK